MSHACRQVTGMWMQAGSGMSIFLSLISNSSAPPLLFVSSSDSFCSKRIAVGGLYVGAEFYMLTDYSEDFKDTEDFIRRQVSSFLINPLLVLPFIHLSHFVLITLPPPLFTVFSSLLLLPCCSFPHGRSSTCRTQDLQLTSPSSRCCRAVPRHVDFSPLLILSSPPCYSPSSSSLASQVETLLYQALENIQSHKNANRP